MEALTIGEIVAAIVICNTLWTFIEKLIEKLIKPKKELEKSDADLRAQHNADISAINKRIDALETANSEQKEAIDSLSKDVHMIIKTNLDMMEHMVTGNHQKAMKKTIKDVQNYLVERG